MSIGKSDPMATMATTMATMATWPHHDPMAPPLAELTKLESIISGTGEDTLVSSAIRKLLLYKKREIKESLKRLEKRLAEFEKSYKLSSEKFELKYHKGQMGDAADFIQWHATFDMQRKIKVYTSVSSS